MLAMEDMRLSAKYLDEFSKHCQNNVCGEECLVFTEHEKDPSISCFKTYCQLRETNKLEAPKGI